MEYVASDKGSAGADVVEVKEAGGRKDGGKKAASVGGVHLTFLGGG